MENVMSWVLRSHWMAGFISLVLFWLPVIMKKGSYSHRKIGKIYVALMWLVVITGVMLAIENWIEGDYITSMFLIFLALITSNPIWYGVAILKNKKGISKNYTRLHFGFNLTIFFYSLVLLGYGVSNFPNGILLIVFGLLGANTGFEIMRDYRFGLKLNWYEKHYKGMVISGIAAYTAFFAFGGSRFLSEFLTGYWMIIPWVLPTIIGTIAMKKLDVKYFRKGNKDRLVTSAA